MAQFSNRAKIAVILFLFLPPSIYAIRFPNSIDQSYVSEGNESNNEVQTFVSENIICHGGVAKVIARILESVPSPGVGH